MRNYDTEILFTGPDLPIGWTGGSLGPRKNKGPRHEQQRPSFYSDLFLEIDHQDLHRPKRRDKSVFRGGHCAMPSPPFDSAF